MEITDGRHGNFSHHDLIQRAEFLKRIEPARLLGTPPSVTTGQRLYEIPALAIPVVTKSNFVCPQAHIDHLEQLLPKVEKILVMGWRGAETHFLKLLSAGLRGPVKVLSACGEPDESTVTNQRMRGAGVAGTFFAAAGGFTDLILSRDGESFMRS
jgi:hypothetical protein